MKRLLLEEKEILKGTYIISIKYYDNDDLIVTVLDFETREPIGYLDIVEQTDLGFDINLN
jgi:hypothetical protein